MMTRLLVEEVDFEVVGFAANGLVALAQDALLKPDVITLDVEMPVMDGLQALRELRVRGSCAKVIMFSALTGVGAASTIDALMSGANDYVTKPAGDTAESEVEKLRGELVPKIRQFFNSRTSLFSSHVVKPQGLGARPGMRLCNDETHTLSKPKMREQAAIVAIGVSTGGPTALMTLLPRLEADFPVPVVIVQHMPPVFTAQLAARLCAVCKLEVVEAAEGMLVERGRVLIAPGDFHLRLVRRGREVVVALDQGERENSCRPAADVLFRSVGEVYGGRVVAVVLTGMGQDGLRGAVELKERGAIVLAQDRASSVVWGMPGAVAEAGVADEVLSLDEVAAAITRQVSSR